MLATSDNVFDGIDVGDCDSATCDSGGCRLHHGGNGGGAEEGGGQAEGPHPLTGARPSELSLSSSLMSQGEELMRVKKATVSDKNFKYFVFVFCGDLCFPNHFHWPYN